MFKLHEENRIGHKVLTDADLGISKTSNQTHIGLSDKVLTFLPKSETISDKNILIYENNFDFLEMYLKRIVNKKDGSLRSPAIRMGERNAISIATLIRDIASCDPNAKWHLMWFGLKNEKVVFYLFSDSSDDYEAILKMGVELKDGTHTISGGREKNLLVDYLEAKVNSSKDEIRIGILKELEVVSQLSKTVMTNRFKIVDLEAARKEWEVVGKLGEALVDHYFEEQVKEGEITSYTWHNRQKESSLPFDFTVQENCGNLIFLDVKTTKYDFAQEVVFSCSEVEYAAEDEFDYHVYRIYSNSAGVMSLRICEDFTNYASLISPLIKRFKEGLSLHSAKLRQGSIAISPTIGEITFGAEKVLGVDVSESFFDSSSNLDES